MYNIPDEAGETAVTNKFSAKVGAEYRNALIGWSSTVGLTLAAGTRQLVCLGLGLSLDEARTENLRMELRLQERNTTVERLAGLAQERAETEDERVAIVAKFAKRPVHRTGALDYPGVTIRLSPETAKRFVTWATEYGFTSHGEALRDALQRGKQRTPAFQPGAPFFGM